MALRNVLDSLAADESNFISLSNQYGQDRLRSDEADQERQLKSISAFSKTLSEYLVSEKKKENKRLYDEGRIEQIEGDIEKEEEEEGSSVSPEEREEYDAGTKQLRDNKLAFDGAALNIAEQGSFEESEKVKNMSGWKLYGYTVQKAVSAGDSYEAWMEGEMANNNEIQISFQGETFTPQTAETLDQKRVAMTALRRKYLQEQGLLGVHKVLLADHFYKKALPAHNKIMANFQKQHAVDQGFLSEEEAIREYGSTKDFGSLVSSLAPLPNSKKADKPYGRRGALDKAFEIVKGQADVNNFGPQDYKDLGDQDVVINGKVVGKVKHYWKTRYKKLGEDLIDEEESNLKISEKEKKNKFTRAENKVIERLKNASPDDLTPAKLLEEKLNLESEHIGFKSTKLDNFIARAMPDAQSLAKQKVEVERLLKYGLLTEEKLLEFDLRLYKEYAGIAKVVSKGKDKTEKYLGYVEDMVVFSGKLLPGGQSHPSVAQMTDIFKMKYRKYYAEAIAAESETPEVDAWNAVREEFGDGSRWKYETGLRAGQYRIDYETDKEQTTKTWEGIRAEKQRQDDLLKKHGAAAIVIPGAFISKEALEENLKTFGTPGWTPPGVVTRLKKRFPEKDELDILKALATANKVKIKIPESPALKVIKDNTSTEEKAVLTQGGANGNARIFGNAGNKKGSPNVELVPNGEGENLMSYANENALSFGDVAASYEFLIANPSIAKSFGLKPDDGNVDWDRLGLAISILGSRFGTKVVDTFESIPGITPDPETDIGKRTGDFLVDTFESIPGIKPDPETDLGKRTGDLIVDTVESIKTLATELGTDIKDWTVDELNDFADSVLGDVDEEQKYNFYKARWKYEPTQENLSSLVRPGFYGE